MYDVRLYREMAGNGKLFVRQSVLGASRYTHTVFIHSTSVEGPRYRGRGKSLSFIFPQVQKRDALCNFSIMECTYVTVAVIKSCKDYLHKKTKKIGTDIALHG